MTNPIFPTNAVNGIDVSNWQGTIQWDKVAASGIQFAYVKATEWTSFVDKQFFANVTSAQKNGIKVGAYHFAHTDSDPVAEAHHFLKIYGQVAGHMDLLPVLDLETPDVGAATKLTPAAVQKWAATWIDTVKKQLGCDVIVYTYTAYAHKFGLHNLTGCPLWVASYGVSTPDATPWSAWDVWQYSDKGIVPGIVGNVDMDIARDLRSISIVRSAPKPTTYTVVAGDTIWSIAQQFNLTVAELESYNPPIKDSSMIHVGDVIHLIAQVAPVAPKPVPAPAPPQPKPAPAPQPAPQPAPVPTPAPKPTTTTPTSALTPQQLQALYDEMTAMLKKLLGLGG